MVPLDVPVGDWLLLHGPKWLQQEDEILSVYPQIPDIPDMPGILGNLAFL